MSNMYSLRFKIKVMIGHRLRYEIKVTFDEVSLKRNFAKRTGMLPETI